MSPRLTDARTMTSKFETDKTVDQLILLLQAPCRTYPWWACNKPRLISSILRSATSKCVTFTYHLFGGASSKVKWTSRLWGWNQFPNEVHYFDGPQAIQVLYNKRQTQTKNTGMRSHVSTRKSRIGVLVSQQRSATMVAHTSLRPKV